MRDIQVFLGFANFYRCFIQSFSKIAGSLTSMLRRSFTTWSSKNLLLSINAAEVDEVAIGGGGDRKDETVRKSLSKNLNVATGYLTLDNRQAFTQLRQTFTKAPILWHFDLECHIRIETNVSGYAIDEVLSQLTLDNLGQWHAITYYSKKWFQQKLATKLMIVSFWQLLKPLKYGNII